MSETPIVSRIECIDKEGTPTSMVRIPVLPEMIGPVVYIYICTPDQHALAFVAPII